ncbi:hypothetical protein GCM10008957_13080 [Deinococcus ruber]|uniref:Uncharacterized protein n=1 Tax=Deinococcus ruber TaxID=1848197 RepID=A0A918C1P9_9DEIO|nr:hypothetical protein GCM10008957_13080 [Deinococcus ruber]
MAKHSYERGRWNRREARRRIQTGGYWTGWAPHAWPNEDPEIYHEAAIQYVQKKIDRSVHKGLHRYCRVYHRLWRRAGNEICRLYVKSDEKAGELDPQPRRLGVMWDIW